MARTTSITPSKSRRQTSRLASLVAELAEGEGISPSRLAEVKFMRTARCHPRGPIAYEPGIFIIVQGRKTGHLGRRKFVYDANNYLVSAVPLPFECEVEATADAPMLGVKIGITPAAVAELCMQMEQMTSMQRKQVRAIEATPLDESLSNCVERLLESLPAADDARILGPQIVREITYRVLCGPLGRNLRALAAPHTHFGQISRILNRIHAECSQFPTSNRTLHRPPGVSVF
jgi:hypothetical protein